MPLYQSVQAMGDLQVKFNFIQPESMKTYSILEYPAHRFKSTAIQRLDKFNRRPIGTGPYKVKQSGLRETKLVKFDSWVVVRSRLADDSHA